VELQTQTKTGIFLNKNIKEKQSGGFSHVRTDGNVNISVTSFLAPTPSVTREFAIAEKKKGPGKTGNCCDFGEC
jgi:hypothetical protein